MNISKYYRRISVGKQRKENLGASQEDRLIPHADGSTLPNSESIDWYGPVLLGSSTLKSLSTRATILDEVIKILNQLDPDEYTSYLLDYYYAGYERFGDDWHYADITTALLAASQLVMPESYLEIGVRRGRSLAMVAATSPNCSMLGFDMWQPDYAGMPNPGPEFVFAELQKLDFSGKIELISGDSHDTVPRYFAENPEAYFDMITVDGDHSENGAEQDLMDVIPRLKVGGILVFDDICHPKHPYLADVWNRVVKADTRFATWEYTDIGYGVAAGIRKEA